MNNNILNRYVDVESNKFKLHPKTTVGKQHIDYKAINKYFNIVEGDKQLLK